MEIIGESLDAVLIDLYRNLQTDGLRNEGSRGDTLELLGVFRNRARD
jgi:hypothetical protein